MVDHIKFPKKIQTFYMDSDNQTPLQGTDDHAVRKNGDAQLVAQASPDYAREEDPDQKG